MSCPEYKYFLQPVLEFYSDNQIYSIKELMNFLKDNLDLEESDYTELLPSGRDTAFHNRISWVLTYLYHAGLLNRPKRGHYQISEEGLRLLSQNIPINLDTLNKYDSFIEFKERSTKTQSKKLKNISNVTKEVSEVVTPDELMENAYNQLNDALASELLKELKDISPIAFEKFVLDLLHKMGYGKFDDSLLTTPRSNDHGIDGIILEDKLGFNKIYVQAKKFDEGTTVNVNLIREFIGAIHNKDGKGLFVTTSKFSKGAQEAAKTGNIILIDGNDLVDYMIEYDFGVSPKFNYQVKKVDTDFFEDYLALE